MTRTAFYRGDLTLYIIDAIKSVILVGDAEAPHTGGWDNDPNLPGSSYVPYVVIRPLTTLEAEGSFGDSNTEVVAPYSLAVFGINREQTEFYADLVRQTIVDLARTVVVLGPASWKIQQARVNSIGGIDRNDETEPSEFSQTDVVQLYMSKEM